MRVIELHQEGIELLGPNLWIFADIIFRSFANGDTKNNRACNGVLERDAWTGEERCSARRTCRTSQVEGASLLHHGAR